MSPRVTPENRIPDIVAAAVSVFSRKGFRLTQMEEIAEEAGVSKATLYYYFKSKAQLFQYVLQYGGDRNDAYPPPDTSYPQTEHDLLEMLREGLRERTELRSIQQSLARKASPADVAAEIASILGEIWELNEKNRTQIIILEKSLFEFPELAQVYDAYARGRILDQIEGYLRARIGGGVIKPLHSVRATARFILESLAWFGFKQPAPPQRLFAKEEALPDLVDILVAGLEKKETGR